MFDDGKGGRVAWIPPEEIGGRMDGSASAAAAAAHGAAKPRNRAVREAFIACIGRRPGR